MSRLPGVVQYLVAWCTVVVQDHGSRDRDVVLERRTIYLEKPRGVGKLEWGGNGEGRRGRGQFTNNLGPRWTGSHHAKEGIPSK